MYVNITVVSLHKYQFEIMVWLYLLQILLLFLSPYSIVFQFASQFQTAPPIFTVCFNSFYWFTNLCFMDYGVNQSVDQIF